jgi:hypothetical protein
MLIACIGPFPPRLTHFLPQRRAVQRFEQFKRTEQVLRHTHASAVVVKLWKYMRGEAAGR